MGDTPDLIDSPPRKTYAFHMRNLVYFIAFAVMILALPASWWLKGRFRREARFRRSEEHRAKADRLAVTAGFGAPPGGGLV